MNDKNFEVVINHPNPEEGEYFDEVYTHLGQIDAPNSDQIEDLLSTLFQLKDLDPETEREAIKAIKKFYADCREARERGELYNDDIGFFVSSLFTAVFGAAYRYAKTGSFDAELIDMKGRKI